MRGSDRPVVADVTVSGNAAHHWSRVLIVSLAVMVALAALPADQARGAGSTVRLDWGAKAPMPTARKILGVAAAPDGLLYAVGGYNDSAGPVATVEAYAPATNTWTTRVSLPTPRAGLGLAAASDGLLYAIGGSNANVVGTVEAYNPATNGWTARAPLHEARVGVGVAAATNGKLYAAGGRLDNLDSLATLEEYDPATDTWVTRTPMPTARAFSGLAAHPNGKLYAVGGFNSKLGEYLATVEEYDPATDTWRSRAPLLPPRVALGLVTASNGKLYAIGGETSGGLSSEVDEYDPSANSWTMKAQLPDARVGSFTISARSGLAVAAAPNGRLYAIGGHSATYMNTVEEYDPQRNTWAVVQATLLPQGRGYAASAVAGGKLYVFGGLMGGNPISAVLQYDPATRTWTTMTPMPTARYGAVAVAAGNGKIYVAGGTTSDAVACPGFQCNTVEEYTPPTGAGGGTWLGAGNGISQLPAPRTFLAMAGGSNGKLYVTGGSDGAGARAETYQYDPAHNSGWLQMASMSQPRSELSLAPAGDGKLYAVGGNQAGGAVTTVERFVLPTAGSPLGRWEGPSGITPLPAARTVFGLIGLPSGRLVAAGGSAIASASAPRAEVYEYDPTANTWEDRPPLPRASFGLSLAPFELRQLFAIGGFDAHSALADVESGIRDEIPSASAGGPYTVLSGNMVQLSASGSDPEGDSLSFAWDVDGSLLYATPGQSINLSTAGLAGDPRTVRVRALEPDPLGGYAVASTTLTIIQAARVAFATQPGGAVVGAPLSPQPVVRLEAADGTLISNFNGPVSLRLSANTSGVALGGTTTINAVNGVATFSGLSVPAPGTGLTMIASSGALQTATSAPFTITALTFCGPRPNVAVATSRGGPGQLQAVISAQTLPATPTNSLQRIAVTRIENATVTVNGNPVSAGSSVPLLAGTAQVTLLVQRQSAGAGSTVSFSVTDICGDWQSFVGGGPSAF
jgi:N-acetylneuraminic acid mutarotase